MTIKEQISLKKVLFRFAISEEREERNKLPIVVLFAFQLGFVVTVYWSSPSAPSCFSRALRLLSSSLSLSLEVVSHAVWKRKQQTSHQSTRLSLSLT